MTKDTLKFLFFFTLQNEIFRKFGRIDKVVLSKRSPAGSNAASVGIYVTFVRKEDASKAIVGLNGMEVDGKTVRYCSC